MPSLVVKGVPAAVQLNFEYNGTYYKKLPAFDMAFSKYALGDLLNVHVLKQCFENGILRFDFLRGDEAYKFKYNPTIRNLYSVSLFAPTRRGILAQQWFERLRPFYKNNEMIRWAANKARGLFRRY